MTRLPQKSKAVLQGWGDYTIDPSAASSMIIFADGESQFTDTVETPDESNESDTLSEPTTPDPYSGSDALEVNLFT